MSFSTSRALITSTFLLAAAAATVIGATEPPDLELNPVTGYVESVDIASESNDRVRHVEDQGQARSRTATLISTGTGASPRIAIDSSGDSWVVWWRDGSTDEVLYSRHDESAGTWSAEAVISEADEDSRYPELTHDGSSTWVVFEADDGAGETTVAVMEITDSPEPFGTRVAVATTDFTGDVDVQVHASSGHVWVTWVDSSSEVGWSEYDHSSESWDLPQYEQYSGGNVKVAMETIQATVVGN